MTDIFGFTWQEIQRAQQRGGLGKPIDTSKPAQIDTPHQADLDLLEKHGAIGLENMGYYGVIDRLRFNGYIEETKK